MMNGVEVGAEKARAISAENKISGKTVYSDFLTAVNSAVTITEQHAVKVNGVIFATVSFTSSGEISNGVIFNCKYDELKPAFDWQTQFSLREQLSCALMLASLDWYLTSTLPAGSYLCNLTYINS